MNDNLYCFIILRTCSLDAFNDFVKKHKKIKSLRRLAFAFLRKQKIDFYKWTNLYNLSDFDTSLTLKKMVSNRDNYYQSLYTIASVSWLK